MFTGNPKLGGPKTVAFKCRMEAAREVTIQLGHCYNGEGAAGSRYTAGKPLTADEIAEVTSAGGMKGGVTKVLSDVAAIKKELARYENTVSKSAGNSTTKKQRKQA